MSLFCFPEHCKILHPCVCVFVRYEYVCVCVHQCNALLLSLSQGIPKLDDANEAGGRHSHDCTLILTEGDSAKTLAVSGLGVVGRDHYGVFPLRGKLLNVREASHNQVWCGTVVRWMCMCVCDECIVNHRTASTLTA